MTNETIPDPGPARDRMVAEVVGWEWSDLLGYAVDSAGLTRMPECDSADALAALEAWCASDATRGYRIDRYGGEELGYLVALYETLSMRVVSRGEDAALPAAATAALLATREGT